MVLRVPLNGLVIAFRAIDCWLRVGVGSAAHRIAIHSYPIRCRPFLGGLTVWPPIEILSLKYVGFFIFRGYYSEWFGGSSCSLLESRTASCLDLAMQLARAGVPLDHSISFIRILLNTLPNVVSYFTIDMFSKYNG